MGRLVSSQTYEPLLYGALLSWLYQTVALAVAIVDLVVTPMAYGIGRGVVATTAPSWWRCSWPSVNSRRSHACCTHVSNCGMTE